MKISIITASYNNEDTIEDTIKSVSEQTYKNIEYIIIDGNSTDNTFRVIENYDANISKIISEPDKGIYDALNKGIRNSTGDVIGFLHADDIYNDNTVIDNVVKLFQSKNVDSVYGNLQYVSKNDINKVLRYWESGDFKFTKLQKGWMPPHPTFFVKKEIYDKYGLFDTTYKIAADYDVILRFLGKHKITTSYIPKVLIKMRVGGASNKSFKNIIIKMQEDFRALKKYKIGGIITLAYKNISKIPQLFKNK